MGTGRFDRLKAAAPSRKRQNSGAPPGVFVSRLHPQTTPTDLGNHIRNRTGLRVRCIALRSRRDDCASFRIVAPDSCVPRLLDEEIWPERVIARRYKFGRGAKD